MGMFTQKIYKQFTGTKTHFEQETKSGMND